MKISQVGTVQGWGAVVPCPLTSSLAVHPICREGHTAECMEGCRDSEETGLFGMVMEPSGR